LYYVTLRKFKQTYSGVTNNTGLRISALKAQWHVNKNPITQLQLLKKSYIKKSSMRMDHNILGLTLWYTNITKLQCILFNTGVSTAVASLAAM
jgi:hypothetical protein